MLVRSDELGDELKQTRSLLLSSIHGVDRLVRLAGRGCWSDYLKDSVRDASGRRSLVKTERTDKDLRLLQA
jgi:hypothetical protein